MKKSLYLIFHGRFPSEKAASLFAAKSAEAFAAIDLDTTLLVPRRLGRSSETAAKYYQIKNNFKTAYIPVLDLMAFPLFKKLTFFISFFSFALCSAMYLLFRASKEAIIFSNESLPLYTASLFFKNTFFEMHDFPESKYSFFKNFFRRIRWILSHNKWKKEKLLKTFDIPESKVILLPNTVEVKDFDIDISKKDAREKLSLPLDQSIAVYTGHLYGWKGVDTLAEAALLLPQVLVVFVGGTPVDVLNFRKKYKDIRNVKIVGHRPHTEIPLWQKASDVLVLPNTAKEDISKYYTSPMKLFEYMASKRPIVASRIPSVAEIVDDRTAMLVTPDNTEELAYGINAILKDAVISSKLVDAAFARVKDNTWDNRARKIVEFLEK
ncbi:MAG: hypothetical protein JWP09_393 [Candidatus Taylorbacteria bacterium]|nr:hypothetical protein [Candidatus Taylorbacteria bacterium]